MRVWVEGAADLGGGGGCDSVGAGGRPAGRHRLVDDRAEQLRVAGAVVVVPDLTRDPDDRDSPPASPFPLHGAAGAKCRMLSQVGASSSSATHTAWIRCPTTMSSTDISPRR